MAKDPAFLFYPNDYLGGTMGMTFEAKGAYIELLMLQFNRGHMTTHMIGHTVGQLWGQIEDKFIKDDKGKYYNVRLEDEQKKRKAFTQSRRNNISGNNQHTKKVGHMTSHMEDENVNEDIIIIKDNKNVENCFNQCLNYFPKHLHPENKSSWIDTIEKLNRIDKIPFEWIVEIVKKTRQDNFWSKNFLSLTKLRKKNKEGIKYIVVFNEKFKTESSTASSKLNDALKNIMQ